MWSRERELGGLALKHSRSAVVVCAAALALTGCQQGDDSAASSNSTTASSATAVAEKPDPGNYPTTPRPALGAANTPFAGRLLDAQRMAGFVTGPWEVDPTLKESSPPQATVIKNAGAVSIFLPEEVAEAARRHDFVNGFQTSRQAADKRGLRIAVLRFADPPAAAAAAADMQQVELTRPGTLTPRSSVPIPGHPDALGSSYMFTPNDSDREQANVTSYTPHGPYVLVQRSQSYGGLDEAVGMIAKAIDQQIPLIDQFAPTPVADFPGLPLDPSGLLARTIPVPQKDAIVNVNATWDRRGIEQFQSDAAGTAQLFADTGTDVVVTGKTNVYQAADEAGPKKIVDAFIAQSIEGATVDDPVTGVPGSKCLKQPTSFYCVAPAGRYAIEVVGTQKTDVHQLVSAQFLMLTAT